MMAAVPSYACCGPLDDLVGIGRVFELDRHGAVVAGVADRREVLLDGCHAHAGGQVAVHLAVAVGEMDVPDETGHLLDVVEGGVREVEVRDVGVRPHRRMVDLLDEADQLVDVLEQRFVERLELQHDLETLGARVLAGALDRPLGYVPDRLAREHLAVPVVLADDEQHVPGAEKGALVDVRLDAVEREPLDRFVEVDQAERDADHRSDRQTGLLGGALDLVALGVGEVERVLEDVVRIEADLLRLADAVQPTDLRAEPGRADHSEFHAVLLV